MEQISITKCFAWIKLNRLNGKVNSTFYVTTKVNTNNTSRAFLAKLKEQFDPKILRLELLILKEIQPVSQPQNIFYREEISFFSPYTTLEIYFENKLKVCVREVAIIS
ncbi:hypothetical protein [Flavitalea sp.]|nr:hypothetical protein [Flavitalea sp.]